MGFWVVNFVFEGFGVGIRQIFGGFGCFGFLFYLEFWNLVNLVILVNFGFSVIFGVLGKFAGFSLNLGYFRRFVEFC